MQTLIANWAMIRLKDTCNWLIIMNCWGKLINKCEPSNDLSWNIAANSLSFEIRSRDCSLTGFKPRTTWSNRSYSSFVPRSSHNRVLSFSTAETYCLLITDGAVTKVFNYLRTNHNERLWIVKGLWMGSMSSYVFGQVFKASPVFLKRKRLI